MSVRDQAPFQQKSCEKNNRYNDLNPLFTPQPDGLIATALKETSDDLRNIKRSQMKRANRLNGYSLYYSIIRFIGSDRGSFPKLSGAFAASWIL